MMAHSDFIDDSESTDELPIIHDCRVFIIYVSIGIQDIITHWRFMRRENIEGDPENTSRVSTADDGGVSTGETTDRYGNGLLHVGLVLPPKSWYLHSFIQSTAKQRSISCLLLLTILMMTGVDCRISEAPQNLAVIRGNKAMMNCNSDRESSLLVWYANGEKGSVKEISFGERINPAFESNFKLNTSFSGQCDLVINTSTETALKYTCFEARSGDRESAELIILDREPKCSNDSLENGTIVMNCTVKVFGNWPPKIIWRKNDNETLHVPPLFTRDGISSTLIVSGTDRGGTYNCTIRFSPHDKPSDTTAAESPVYVFTKSWEVPDYDDAGSTNEEHKDTETGNQHPNMEPTIIIVVTLGALAVMGLAILFMVRWKRSKERNRSLNLKVSSEPLTPRKDNLLNR